MDYRLYAITDYTMDNATLLQAVEKAATGGITILQYRPKHRETGTMIRQAQAIKEILRPHAIPLIVNDYPEVAKMVQAEGVHLGQGDMRLKQARAYLGNTFSIGLSVGSVEDCKTLDSSIVDYVGCGPMYETQTKADAGVAIGIKKFQKIKECAALPTVAIGGITLHNATAVIRAGADGIAVISAIFRQKDIVKVTQNLRQLWS